jgi:exodeoxyribonuclease VII small subunit
MNAHSPDVEAASQPDLSPPERSPAEPQPADVATMPFDRALAELQAVVGKLESGGLPLEQSIALYERGVALHERCASLLTAAELRVQRLVEGAGGSIRALDLRPDDDA